METDSASLNLRGMYAIGIARLFRPWHDIRLSLQLTKFVARHHRTTAFALQPLEIGEHCSRITVELGDILMPNPTDFFDDWIVKHVAPLTCARSSELYPSRGPT